MSNKNNDYKNLDQRQKDCLALIESLGIYELRALARVFGDNSPTTLKRDDHIKIIMDKIISGEDLRPIPLRQGRPYKELSNIDGILSELSVVAGKDYTSKSNPVASSSIAQKSVSFHQVQDDVLKQKLLPVDARGVLREKSLKEFYFRNLENNTLVLVRKDMDARLQPNDYVTGSAILMNDDGDYALDIVKTINFRSDKLYVPIDHPYEQALPSKKFGFCGQEIVLGGRYVLKTPKFLDETEKIQKTLKQFNENNVITLALIPNVLKEDELALKNLGFNAPFFINYEEHPQNAYETVVAFLDCATRLQEQGLNLAIFVEDALTLANLIDFSYKNNAKSLTGHTEIAVETIKRLMLLPKADKDGAHTTLFTTQDETDLADPMYVSNIYKISKKI